MQAIKPHSPSTKTCSTNNNKSTNNKSSSSSSSDNNTSLSAGKSVAQRVMDVTNSNSTAPITSNANQQTAVVQNNNSAVIEGDQEVEEITNRAAKLEVGGGQQQQSYQQQQTGAIVVKGDQNNNNCTSLKVTDSSSTPSLLHIDTITAQNTSSNGSSSAHPPSSFNNASLAMPASLVSSESVFRQIVSKNQLKPEQVSSGVVEQPGPQTTVVVDTKGTGGIELGVGATNSNAKCSGLEQQPTETRISLDTKVPHPSKTSDFQHVKKEVEEVSYYNDTQATTSLTTQLDVDPKATSTTKNNTNGQQQTITTDKSSGGRPKALSGSTTSKIEHKLSVIVPKRHLQPNSREYLNEINEYNLNEEDNDEDEDDSDSRYHNAIVGMVDFKASQHPYGSMSIPTSPKAKSAPATPCNVTPTAFHQHTSHINSMLNPSPANTLPPDIRKNISATCRVLPSSMPVGANHSQMVSSQHLDELSRRGDASLESKDYVDAIHFYTRCIDLATNHQNLPYLRKNFKVYSQRAEAHFNLGNYNEAIDDSMAARELNPKWTQAYYRQGRSQFLIGQYADSLAVFSFGLAQEPTNKRLFDALVDAALRSPIIPEFESKYNKLKSLNLEKKPFVVVSIVGQELLGKGHGEHAAIILESALKMGPPDNKKLKGSVLSTIAYAYCLIKDYEKAIIYMQKELDVESELEDVSGQCRVLSNIGYTYYKLRKFDKSLESHRMQLTLALRTHLFQQASMALNAMGHVHVARNDFASAQTSHKRCLDILKQLGDNDYNQYKELLSIGHAHSMMGEYENAEEKYNEAIQLLENSSKISKEEYHTGLVMVNFNLAYLALKKPGKPNQQCFIEAKHYYKLVITLAQRIQDQTKRALFEMRASHGMGQTCRLFKNFEEARIWFEKQLQLAEQLKDRVTQSQALCNLGMTYQHFKDYNNAWKLFDDNLRLVEKDPLLKAYAHSYMGSMYFLMNKYNEAQAHYEKSLNTFKDLDYCSAERKTIDLNMAAVHERMGHSEVNLSINGTQQKKVVMA